MTYQRIVVPLLVMLLLTVLMGGTAYQLIQNWETASVRVNRQMAEAVILNDIRIELLEARNALNTNRPEAAGNHWRQAKNQFRLLSGSRMEHQALVALDSFFRRDQNIQNIDLVIDQNVFRAQLKKTEAGLDDLQRYSRYVTISVTASMIILGLVLMVITAWDLNRMVNQLAASRDLNMTIQEEERRRIAQDLHDSVIQSLVDIRRDYRPDKVDGLIEGIRRICHNLKPQVLDDLGLAAAIRFLADDLKSYGSLTVNLNLDEEGLGQLPKAYELPIFRVVQEALYNVRRHADADTVTVSLVYNPAESDMLRGTVRDNGRGFDPAETQQGMGLTGIRERVRQLDGRITIDSTPGQGTRLVFVIPVKSSRLVRDDERA